MQQKTSHKSHYEKAAHKILMKLTPRTQDILIAIDLLTENLKTRKGQKK